MISGGSSFCRTDLTARSTGSRQAVCLRTLRAALLVVVFFSAQTAVGQLGSASSSTGPTQAAQVPLSGRGTGGDSVVVMQQTLPSTPPGSVNVINSTVTILGAYAGGVPSGALKDGVVQLTLADALAMGLKQNLGELAQTAAVQQAKGQREIARSQLLPQLNTTITESFDRINLRTQGVNLPSIPTSVQFNYYDARVRLNQSVFDLVRIRNLHGATENVKANIRAARNARDLVVLAVAGSYLQLVSTQSRLAAAEAQVQYSRAVAKQATDRFSAGLATRVDAMRAQVQLQTEQERLRSLQADNATQKLKLARLIGLPLGQQFAPGEDYPFTSLDSITVDSSLDRAFHNRSDLQAADSALKVADASVKAAHAEHLPTMALNGDFGAAGVTPTNHSTGVYTATGTLLIPIFEGGRIHGDEEQARAAQKQRKAELEDTRAQVDQDVRQAFIDLDAAADQVLVAKSNVDLSHASLEQSTDRFIAGVTDTVEVVQAEQAVVQADDDYITAVYEHNLAKVSLARAMGDAEQMLPQLLRK